MRPADKDEPAIQLDEFGRPQRSPLIIEIQKEFGIAPTLTSEETDVVNDGVVRPIITEGLFSSGGNKKNTDHGGVTYTRVFANAEAADYINLGNVQFPVGSTIVREKLASPSAIAAELLTVMVKRGKGFSPRTNDWEFIVIGQDLNTIKKREKTGKCADCHSNVSQSDFVYKANYQTAGN